MTGLSLDLLTLVGWLGQACFFLRFLVQWWASERAGRIVVPRLFWWVSLLGALCSFTYALAQASLVFMASPAVNLFVYSRNLALDRAGRSLRREALIPLAAGLTVLVGVSLVHEGHLRFSDPPFWLVVGLLGQLCWMSRFPIQWYLSEREGRATLPPVFYWISLLGSLLLLAYALHTWNAVWIAGMLLGPILYSRGLWLSYHPRPDPAPPP